MSQRALWVTLSLVITMGFIISAGLYLHFRSSPAAAGCAFFLVAKIPVALRAWRLLG